MCSILLQDNFVMSLKDVFHSNQTFSKTTLLCHSNMCSIQANPSPRQLCYVTQDVFHSSQSFSKTTLLCHSRMCSILTKLLQDNFVMSLKDVFHSSQSFSKTTLLCHSNMCSIQANPSPRQLCYVTQICVPFKPILLQDNFVMSLKYVFHSSQSFSKTTLLCHSRMCSIQANPSPRQLCYVTQICVPFKPILLQDNFVMSLKDVFHSSQSFSKTTLLCHSRMCSIQANPSPRQLCYVTQICVPFKPILLQDNFVMSLKYVFHSSQSFSKTTLLCHSNMCSIQANPSPRQLCYVTQRCVPFFFSRQLCYVTQICVPFKPILLQDNFVMSLKDVFHSNQSFSKTTLLCHSNMCSIQANPSPRQLCYVTQGCVPFKPILLQDNFVMSLKYVFHSSQSFSKTTLLCHSRMCSIQTNPSPRQLCYVTQICVPFKPILLQDNFVMSLKYVFHSSQSFSKTTLLCHSNMCSIQANPSPRQLCYVTQRCVPFKPILLQDNFVMSLKMCSIQVFSIQLCYVTQDVFHSSSPDNFVMSLKYVFHSSQSFSKTTLLCHSNMCSIQANPSPRQLCYVTQICVPFKPILLQDNFVMSLKDVFHSSQSFSKTTLLCHSNMCSIQANPSPRQLCYVTQICVPFKPILLQDNFVMSLKDVFHSSQSFSKTTLLCHSRMCSIQANPSP